MNKKVCGAKLRGKNAHCQKSPMANGRCRLHGGKTPSGPDSANFRHGRYAAAFKNQLAAKFDRASADAQPLDLLPELATQRAVLEQYLEIVNAKKKLTAGALANVNALTTDVVSPRKLSRAIAVPAATKRVGLPKAKLWPSTLEDENTFIAHLPLGVSDGARVQGDTSGKLGRVQGISWINLG